MAYEMSNLFMGKKKRKGNKKDMEGKLKNEMENTSEVEATKTGPEPDKTSEQDYPDEEMNLTQIVFSFSGKKKPKKKKNIQSDAIFLESHASGQAISYETVSETSNQEYSYQSLSERAQDEEHGELYTYKEVSFPFMIILVLIEFSLQRKQTFRSIFHLFRIISTFKDMPGVLPKSDLLGVTVALIHVAECDKSIMAKNRSYPLGHP